MLGLRVEVAQNCSSVFDFLKFLFRIKFKKIPLTSKIH
jgi:hypothetical protein